MTAPLAPHLLADLLADLLPGFLAETTGHNHHSWRDFTPTTWIAVFLAAAVTAWVIWKAVMYTIDPGEEEADHIKRLILSDPKPERDDGGLPDA